MLNYVFKIIYLLEKLYQFQKKTFECNNSKTELIFTHVSIMELYKVCRYFFSNTYSKLTIKRPVLLNDLV